MRLQLFSADGALISDRLVAQDTEIYKGPKEPAVGPVRVEFTLVEQSDIQLVKEYLDMLYGILPIEGKKEKKVKSLTVDDTDDREKFLTNLISRHKTTDQDQLIRELRDNGFVFVMTDHLESMGFDGLHLKPGHKDKYQWMIRMLKRAKSPKNDKYDPMLIFGINLMGERTEKVPVYLNGMLSDFSFSSPIPDKPRETFKKSGMIKFPEYMTLDERERFRIELRLLQDNPEKEESKFFKRWKQYVQNLPKLGKEE